MIKKIIYRSLNDTVILGCIRGEQEKEYKSGKGLSCCATKTHLQLNNSKTKVVSWTLQKLRICLWPVQIEGIGIEAVGSYKYNPWCWMTSWTGPTIPTTSTGRAKAGCTSSGGYDNSTSTGSSCGYFIILWSPAFLSHFLSFYLSTLCKKNAVVLTYQ